MAHTTHMQHFYIGGNWVDPLPGGGSIDVINPATEEAFTQVALGTQDDTARAIDAAHAAFASFSQTPVADRIELLFAIRSAYKARIDDIAAAISDEMGAPLAFAKSSQALAGLAHISSTAKALKDFPFETQRGTTRIVHEAIGLLHERDCVEEGDPVVILSDVLTGDFDTEAVLLRKA